MKIFDMPVNRNALIRYRTIDNCLQNRFRKWTLDDLIEACSAALCEFEGIDKGVSRRSVQADIEMMRGDKLGYEAPIIVIEKKFYTYADKAYSITNIPLSHQDMKVLGEVTGLLKQFKGFNHFAYLTEMVSKLEDKIHAQKTQSIPVVDFEKNDNLRGLEFVEGIRKAIVSKTTLWINYQSFRARQASIFCFSAYLLKEYRNRWFVLGQSHQKHEPIMTLALDRFQSFSEDKNEAYRENEKIDLTTYYSDVIGVTKNLGQRDINVVFWMDHKTAPYVETKPLHHTQRLVREDDAGKTFAIKVVPNFELERELLGFGARIKVLAPRNLKKRIKEQLIGALGLYE